MLNNYTFKSNIGSGCLGLVDLYTYKNKKYVVKTQPLLPQESNLSRFNPEFSFARLVHLMPDNESKYFMKLLGYEIVKGIPFDTSKLCKILDPEPSDDIVMRLRNMEYNSDTCYLRLLYPYVGESLFEIIVRMSNARNIDYKFMRGIFKDLIDIVHITRKYKWYIRDLHWGNICVNNSHAVLIDYGNIIDMYCNTDDWIIDEFAINSDYWKIIKIAANVEYYRGELKEQFTFNDDYFAQLKAAIESSRKYKLIKKYMDKFNSNISEPIVQFEYMNVLFCLLDNSAYNEFWSSWQYHVRDIPLLLNQQDIIWLLNNYFI